jgi:hypothetical protein
MMCSTPTCAEMNNHISIKFSIKLYIIAVTDSVPISKADYVDAIVFSFAHVGSDQSTADDGQVQPGY